MATVTPLERLRAWQRLLDEAFPIPGTRWRFGWDAIAGLVPGAGDLVSGLFGLLIIYHAFRMRVPAVIVARMTINLALDLAMPDYLIVQLACHCLGLQHGFDRSVADHVQAPI